MIKDLIQSVKEDVPIRKILVGVHWTAVSSRHCGIAATLQSNKPHGDEIVQEAGNLEGKSALAIANLAFSDSYLERSIGFAALNSLIPIPKNDLTKKNVFEMIHRKCAGKNTAIFGHFPHLEEIQQQARTLHVFELEPVEGQHALDQVEKLLPPAEIVAITSNALMNGTIQDILPFIRTDAYTVLVGPSTPLSPLLFHYGFSLLAGVQILNEDKVFHMISQGAIFRQMKGIERVVYTMPASTPA